MAAMRIRPPRPWLLLGLALLAGCSAGGGSGQSPAPAATPEPSAPGVRALRVALGTDRPAYALLLQEQGARRLWRTEDGFALMTDGPRVTATSGQPQVLMGTRIDGADPLAMPEALLAREAPAMRLVDLGTADRSPAAMRFGVEIACRLRAAAPEEQPEVIQVEENCRGQSPVGAFTNRFTLRRADGAAVASQQWIGPGLPPLAIEHAP